MKNSPRAVIHDGAIVAASAFIGDYAVIYAGARVEGGCVVQGFTQIWDGVELGACAQIGAGVVFGRPSDTSVEESARIRVRAGARVGAGAVLEPDVDIGEGAVVSPGAWVAQSVPAWAIVAGSPARITGYVESRTAQSKSSIQSTLRPELDSAKLGVGNVSLHRLKLVRDPRGDLCAGEIPSQVPFVPKRYFLVFNVPTEKARGEHAHRACHQFLTCVHGSCAVVVDDGESRCEVTLDTPDLGIYLPPLIWGVEYKYSAHAVLLVFASEHYDPDDYIRDYSEFLGALKARDAVA